MVNDPAFGHLVLQWQFGRNQPEIEGLSLQGNLYATKPKGKTHTPPNTVRERVNA
jgi:hypothetical protein